MISARSSHPVLSCADAHRYEREVLHDEAATWSAMCRAGCGIARAVVEDYRELRAIPERMRILALIGKGHNGGDALIACAQLLADFPRARVELVLTAPSAELKPLTARACQQLEGRVLTHRFEDGTAGEAAELLARLTVTGRFHLCIDGLLGMSFQPPLRAAMASLIEAVNGCPAIDLRAAVDLPSGASDAGSGPLFTADFSYATGIAKQPLFAGIADCGRVRYVDLGFFEGPAEAPASPQRLLTTRVLEPLIRLRPAGAEKRSFGHLFVVGGSAYMPGALLMAVQAAVRSGVGLVTAFAPESVAASLSAQVPEAMWIPWPESSQGTLSPRALPLLTDRMESATALLLGPGLGKDRNTELLAQEIVGTVGCPLLLDADSLRTRVVEVINRRKPGFGEVVITPHMGEFMRVAKLREPDFRLEKLREFCGMYRVITLLKGPNTRICDGETVWYHTHGGPVLSRGGSGDLLAGLIGGMMAQTPDRVLGAVSRGALLHGMAAEQLARKRGQVAVCTTQLLEFLPEVLRSLDTEALMPERG